MSWLASPRTHGFADRVPPSSRTASRISRACQACRDAGAAEERPRHPRDLPPLSTRLKGTLPPIQWTGDRRTRSVDLALRRGSRSRPPCRKAGTTEERLPRPRDPPPPMPRGRHHNKHRSQAAAAASPQAHRGGRCHGRRLAAAGLAPSSTLPPQRGDFLASPCPGFCSRRGEQRWQQGRDGGSSNAAATAGPCCRFQGRRDATTDPAAAAEQLPVMTFSGRRPCPRCCRGGRLAAATHGAHRSRCRSRTRASSRRYSVAVTLVAGDQAPLCEACVAT